MVSANSIRVQVEAALSGRIPSALTPLPRILRPVSQIGIPAIDDLLAGGIPVGALTEMVGPECSGRTSLALSFVAQLTKAGKVCAWIDVSNTLRPDAAAASGIELARMLWVRCGVGELVPSVERQQHRFRLQGKYLIAGPAKKGLHGGGFGPHPREEQKRLSNAVGDLFRPNPKAIHHDAPQIGVRREASPNEPTLPGPAICRKTPSNAPYSRIEQALRAADLLLQGGGFSAIILDMGSLAPTYTTRIPLATWFRYRAAAERSQASIVLLSQYACAKSSAELVVHLESDAARCDETTVFTGIEHRIKVERQRFTETSKVVPLKKPVQRAYCAAWKSHSAWAGRK
jgi:recombination protein RecA